ncbi:cofilin [Globomyces sp. JEL0801]|nr:cofilin [Globomyces sp. JEL0801]
MSSGVQVQDIAVEVFQELKLKKSYRYIIFSLSDDFTTIGVLHKSEKGTYDEFLSQLPKDGCRYAVYDFEFPTPDGIRNKLLFYAWSPDTAKIKQKMLYASSKDGLRKKLDGVYTEVQGTDLSEVSYETVTRMSS